MVLPKGQTTLTGEIEVIEESNLPSKTYNLDFKNGKFIGTIDGIEAIKQAVFKILMTNRFENVIYSDNYGFENPVGKDRVFIKAELPRRIREALLQDERIKSVDNISIEFNDDNALVNFTCITIHGDLNISQEVNGVV